MKRREMEMVAVRGLVLMPDSTVSFDIGRRQSKLAIKNALQQDSEIFLVCQKNIEADVPGIDDMYEIGTIAKIVQVDTHEKGLLRVVVNGIKTAHLECLMDGSDLADASEKLPAGYYHAVVTPIAEEEIASEHEEEACRRNLLQLVENLFSRESDKEARLLIHLTAISSVKELIYEIAQHINMPFRNKQQLLEESNIEKRASLLGKMLSDEIEIIKVRYEIAKNMRTAIDENQKKYIYREQIRALQKELGEDDEEKEEIQEYYERAESLCASEEVKEKITKSIKRLEGMSHYMSEAGVLKDYIETMLEMPWDKVNKENHNLAKAKKILEKDHYGLDKIKERIIEHLAVHINKEDAQAPILCLVGPPGTGKTSIAKSIARALNRKYERVCLGGVRDEAEIRGHRKTYVGAMPGRIATALSHAQTSNPLLLLDEIDKMGSDHRGDISAAMLEVLDSEQNDKFRDHYLETPMNLSRVFFVATANSLDTIPRPLLDRMEIIEVSSYLEQEKYHIAKQYLVPKQMAKTGLGKKQFSINKNALYEIIRGYTREAGVRNLERKIGTICRKVVKELLEKDVQEIKVTPKNLQDYLGAKRYSDKKLSKKSVAGMVHGLAWTAVGGDTLDIEVILLPGEGKVTFTGNMGDVMKESAQLASLCVRKQLMKEEFDSEFFKKHDIHLHIPEGAVPKDGPSAGITMATAMYSAITNKPVNYNLAMTGELSLLGHVLAIGGLKEKLVAAKARGITQVIVPKENKKDVDEIAPEVLEGIEIHYVSMLEEVIELAMVQE